MGTYLPKKPSSPRSIDDALQEAEEDHLVDCHNAELSLRVAAVVLDGIFLSLLSSGIENIGSTVVSYAIQLSQSFLETDETFLKILVFSIQYATLLVKTLTFYFYMVQCVCNWGGTPAKLLFGLRVIDALTGKKLVAPRAFVREIILKPLSLCLVVGAIMPLVRKDRRSLHDLILGTVVKKLDA